MQSSMSSSKTHLYVVVRFVRFRLKLYDEIEDRLPEYMESEPLPKVIPSSVTIICNLPGDKHKTVTADGLLPSSL